MLRITFKYSNSASCRDALVWCAGLKGFNEFEIDGKLWFSLSLSHRNIKYALPAIRNIQRLKYRTVESEEGILDFDTTFGFLPCYRDRLRSKNPNYCFGNEPDGSANLFGCRATNAIEYFKAGSFNERLRRWTYSKKRMKGILREEVKPCAHCPSFDLARADGIIDAIPMHVFPDKDWINYEYHILTLPVRSTKWYRLRGGYMTGVRIIGQEILDLIGNRIGRTIPNDVIYNPIVKIDLGDVYDPDGLCKRDPGKDR